ncbi:MAG: phosphoribosylformylglycinamidine synthase [Spirochaetales bacterium]|nr:phosphoribosylformylglycinamidine synthase [Spirochaetales bacterium]
MRIEIAYKPELGDGRAERIMSHLRAGRMAVSQCRIIDAYMIDGVVDLEPARVVDLFCEKVSQTSAVDRPLAAEEEWWDGAIEIVFKPGVTDPIAITAREALELELGRQLGPEVVVQQARQYLFALDTTDALSTTLENIAAALHNPLIQRAIVVPKTNLGPTSFPGIYPRVTLGDQDKNPLTYDLVSMRDDELLALSVERLLALTLGEMKVIQAYYQDPTTQEARRRAGLPVAVTDIELEMLGQSWSEHCKHKIFAARIQYDDASGQEPIEIAGLFSSYIKKTTDDLTPLRPDLRSVFHDNSGVVDFDEDTVMCFKAETHNSPSALDPYGGAITGIVGVNRDILGTGKGAWPFFNTNVLCFGHPDTPGEQIPEGLLPPSRVMAGVHEGIIDGGNQSGIPVAAGAFLFDESYLGKPLVFCGTGGLMPRKVRGEESWVQHIDAGDLAVMAGGRIGKDGIHGATFSSLELDETSPTSAVQIGDPITQRKMIDFLLEARDLGLYKGITDNGAGGLSSSLGEMAEYSGGVRVDLDLAPLKYEGLSPWEIWVSESQERMSLALDPSTWDDFAALAQRRGVEVSVIGQFTDNGFVDLRYRGKTLGLLSLEFIHDGLPKMNLRAQWEPSTQRRTLAKAQGSHHSLPNSPAAIENLWLSLLEEPNIRSKEPLVRQYDHEVQGRSVGKPFTGTGEGGVFGPTDGGALRPRIDSYRGVSVTHGINPRVGDDDTYKMAVLAVDEAYRSHIALGGDPLGASALDNFCWPDPVEGPGTPDGAYKMAQLVRANQGLRDACLAYTLPLVSGKDSMKNDVRLGGVKVSVRPTLLVSLFGIIPDLRRLVSSDFKAPGDEIWLVGTRAAIWGGQKTKPANQPGTFALGGSFLEKVLAGPQAPARTYGGDQGFHLGAAPNVDLSEAPGYYQTTARALEQGLFTSIHDLSDGGLAVALAESAMGGSLGCVIDVATYQQKTTAGMAELLFNEEPTRFLVTLRPGTAGIFEELYKNFGVVRLGTVEKDQRIKVQGNLVPPVTLRLDDGRRTWGKGWQE